MDVADASEEAYACVCYVVAVDEEGNRKASLVFAKTRMRPLSKNNSGDIAKFFSIVDEHVDELEVADRLQKVVTATFFLATLVIYYGDDGRFLAKELLLHRT